MDMLRGEEIAAARLADWRKLAQGLHARYLIADFGAGAGFLQAVGEAGDGVGHHPHATLGSSYVDLRLVTDDAIYRADDGNEYVIQWVTQQDIDLARKVSELAGEHGLTADPASVVAVELGLDASDSARIAPVWAALLTGNPESQGFGTPSDEVRDLNGRVPNLWFGDLDPDAPDGAAHRFHVEVYVAAEVAPQRIEAAIAAGATIVDDSNAPGLVVLADPEGNRGVLCVDTSAAN